MEGSKLLEMLTGMHLKSKGQCVLVFPKAFEEQQFLASLVDLGFTIQDHCEGKFNFNLIHWEAVGSVLAIQTVSFDSSDVLFAASLVELIQHKQSAGPNLNLILCGTCGADATIPLGECFEIHEAMKIDRGDMYLNGTQVHIELRPSMRVALKPKHKSFHRSATAVCSNYLMHASPYSLYKAATGLSNNGAVVADMETFEFFMICDKTKVRQYRALRVVSDTTFLNQSLAPDKAAAVRKEIRKAISMKSLVIMVNKIVSEDLSNGSSTAYHDHVKQRILRSAKVRFENIPRPDFERAISFYGAENVVKLEDQWKKFEADLAESRELFNQLSAEEKYGKKSEESKTESEKDGRRMEKAIEGSQRKFLSH